MFSLARTKLERLATCTKKNKTLLQMEVLSYSVDSKKKKKCFFLGAGGAGNEVGKILTHTQKFFIYIF